ncbi:MAG: hypothetical protein E7668_01605 [Ruminococcaceae bacterium]|nr:hypothetical protein [Oscillospiraceae bacterium]
MEENKTKQQELKEQILSLCGIMSVSGFEPRATEAIREKLGAAFDELTVDAVGNHLLVKRCGRAKAPLVLVDAHFDEIGMLVTELCEDGFVRVASVGGLSATVLQAADVILYGKEPVRGVVTSTPPHLKKNDEESLPEAEELLVDTGYSKERLAELVSVGTPVGFSPCYSELLGGCLAGKSFDNKACAAIAAYAIAHTPKERLAADVAFLLSSYEETSAKGGVSAATYRLQPDYAMVIDVNLATVPDVPKRETVPLGAGVSLSVSAATDRRLTAMTRALCEDRAIPHTMIAAPSSTGTNATSVNLVRGGIPVVDVGLPLRSMHTYNEVISLKDAQALCELVEAFIGSQRLADTFGYTEKEELPI